MESRKRILIITFVISCLVLITLGIVCYIRLQNNTLRLDIEAALSGGTGSVSEAALMDLGAGSSAVNLGLGSDGGSSAVNLAPGSDGGSSAVNLAPGRISETDTADSEGKRVLGEPPSAGVESELEALQINDGDSEQSREDEERRVIMDRELAERLSIMRSLEEVEGLSPAPESGYIFIGDSRFVNMNDVCKISDSENLFMVAKVGEGYNWFRDTALKQVKRIVSTKLFPEWKLIICLGINDLGNRKKYLDKYIELKEDYDITLVSVNPVYEYPRITNSEVQEFNSFLEALGLPYIDTYNVLMSTGYETSDGLHYKPDTTWKIYKGILAGLKSLEPDSLSEKKEVLGKAELNQKKSLQRQILEENKYVKKEPVNEGDGEKNGSGSMNGVLNNPIQGNGVLKPDSAGTREAVIDGESAGDGTDGSVNVGSKSEGLNTGAVGTQGTEAGAAAESEPGAAETQQTDVTQESSAGDMQQQQTEAPDAPEAPAVPENGDGETHETEPSEPSAGAEAGEIFQ